MKVTMRRFAITAGILGLAFSTLSPLLADDAPHPFVDAGSSRSIWLNRPTLNLKGSLQGIADTAEVTWSKTLGAGNVTFSNAHALETVATFDAAGTYELQLEAKDAAGDHTDRLTVAVYDPTKEFLFDSWVLKAQKVKQDFGYTDDDLQKYFTGDLHIEYDLEGLDYSRLLPPPAPGVHPRILMNPEQKPDLVNRLNTTKVGQLLMKAIDSEIDKNLIDPKGNYGALYLQLVAGDESAVDPLLVKNARLSVNYLYAYLTYEIFRDYVRDNTESGQKAVTALTTVAKRMGEVIQQKSSYDWRDVNSDCCGHQFLGYAYDFGYNFMTPEQQVSVRATLASATTNQWTVSLDALPAYSANCSNWAANNDLYLLIDALAVEGEPGSDPYVFPRLRAAYERFLCLGLCRDGALYEGMGKGQINAEALVALAKRGKYLIAASPKKHVRSFYLHNMETNGYGFTGDELLGGHNGGSKYADVATLKYAFPDDPVIDFVYRNDLGTQKGGDLTRDEGLNHINFGFIYQTPDTLVRAIFATDCDLSKTWADELKGLNGQEPPTGFFTDRGLLVTRSSWDPDAVRLIFQPRSEPGGHSIPDRNYFLVSGLGRVWIPYVGYGNNYKADGSAMSNVVRIDGRGPSTFAARVVDFQDSDLLTAGVGDARIPYSKVAATEKDGTIVDYTFNQNRLHPGPESWADMKWGDLCHWYTSEHDHQFWKDGQPVQRAFRTAALVRGKTPYVLVVDDIQQDATSHDYTWRVAVANDLTVTVNGNDAILSDPTNNKRMLVRLLEAKGSPAVSGDTIEWTGYFNRKSSQKILNIETTAVAPDFKVLLLPYLDGTPLPITSYQNGSMSIEMANGQSDRIECAPDSTGLTRLKFKRLKQASQ